MRVECGQSISSTHTITFTFTFSHTAAVRHAATLILDCTRQREHRAPRGHLATQSHKHHRHATIVVYRPLRLNLLQSERSCRRRSGQAPADACGVCVCLHAAACAAGTYMPPHYNFMRPQQGIQAGSPHTSRVLSPHASAAEQPAQQPARELTDCTSAFVIDRVKHTLPAGLPV